MGEGSRKSPLNPNISCRNIFSGPIPLVADKTIIKEWEDRMERTATTTSSLEARVGTVVTNGPNLRRTLKESVPQGTRCSSGPRCQDTILGGAKAQSRFEAASKQSNDPPLLRVNTLRSGEDSMQLKELMELLLVNAASHTLTAVRHKLMLPGITYYCWKPEESNGFEGIIDFSNASSIRYALTVNPTIYTSCIKQFWATTKAKTVNGEVQIQALVDGKKVIVTETSVRRALQLKDAEGGVKFLMYPRFVQEFLDKQVEEMTKHKEIYVTPSHTKKVFANMKREGKGFSVRVTPLFQTMMVQDPEELDAEVPQPSGSIEPITDEAANEEHVPTYSNDILLRVLDLENTKTSQAAKNTKLKERVKKLERRNKSRTPGVKRLRKGRKIIDLDADAEEVEVEKVVSTAEVTTVSATTTTVVDELTLAQALIKIKAAKPKAITTTATTTTIDVTRPKARGVVVQEPTMMEEDYELAQRLQAEEQGELTIEERSKLFVELMDKRKKHFAKLRAE
ncbi:hypothetical protein Tco_0067231 [Tanacetum coccineum]